MQVSGTRQLVPVPVSGTTFLSMCRLHMLLMSIMGNLHTPK